VARIRSIKPELRKSLTVAAWPREVRYAWVLLWGYLDDHGYGVDDIRLVVADLFPLDRDVTEAKMEKWLQLMAEKPRHDPEDEPALCRYEAGGRRFMHAVKWRDTDRWKGHQRVSHPGKVTVAHTCPIHDPEGLF
jgi:hypothetical protein